MKTQFLFSTLLLAGLALAGVAADLPQALSELLPTLADADLGKRSAAQMNLQRLAADSSRPGNETNRAALGELLAATATDAAVPQVARVWIVRQLEYMGREEAVDALTRLLGGEDAELRECARRALEKNPAASVNATLRTALQKGGDEVRQIGFIHVLGERRDADAVPILSPDLNDTKTAWAAALALGKIASDPAIEALWKALAKNSFCDQALIHAANRRLAAGDAPAALVIYRKLNDAEQPVPVRAAALAGLVEADPQQAADRIAEGLTSNEPRLQQAVLAAAQRALGPEATAPLIALLPKLASPAKVQVLRVVAASAENDVLKAAADADETVRLAALEALGRIGGAASVPVLLDATAREARPERTAAEHALAQLSGPGAGEAITRAAGAGTPERRRTAIAALAARGDVSARPALLQYAADGDPAVRTAALSALGKVGADTEIEPVARLALATRSPEALAALEAMTARVQDKSAAAQRLLALAGADVTAKSSLMNALVALGGSDAVAAVSKLLGAGDAKTQESAVRALVNSSEFAAVAPLLSVVANPQTETTQYILALASVVRLVKTAEAQPAADRVGAANAALAAARADQERRMVLSAFGVIPHPEAAATLKAWVAKPEFKAEAAQAGISLIRLLAKSDRAVAADLGEAIKAANVSAEVNQQVARALR